MIPAAPTDGPLWLCLYFSQLPLEVFTRGLGKDERLKPVVVTERHRICRLNEAARDIGIAPGNNMDTAYTLSERVVEFERDENREFRHLSQLAQWAYRFTPNVSIKAPDSLLLDIAGCLKLFRGLDALARQTETGLRKLGYRPTIGVNKTPLAALVCARSGSTGTSIESLAPLPITSLPVDEKHIEALEQMGIADIGSLLRLPEGGLNRRFGTFFVDWLKRLEGVRADPQKFISPEPRFFGELTFLADVTNSEALVFPAKRLLAELCDFLTVRQLCANHLTWTLSHRSHPPVSFNVSLASPENDEAIFMPLIRLKLDRLDGVKEVDSLSLAVNRFFAGEPASGDLFHGTRFERQAAPGADANQLLNLLNARLGPGACHGLAAISDHRPEKAWQWRRIGQPAPMQAPAADDNPRPVFLLDTPRPLDSVAGHPCLGGRLALLKGPERIDFGWWDESDIAKPIARDYYVARQPSGALFWIFHCPDRNAGHKRWYLHGIFS